MKEASGIIIIKKYDENHLLWKKMIDNTKLIKRISLKDAVSKYKGFEGRIINLKQNNIVNSKYCWLNDNELESIENYFAKEFDVKKYNLLLISNYDRVFNEDNLKYSFAGYDYGMCFSEDNIYSSIFHEVLFGNNNALTEFNNKLNNNLLFPSYEIAKQYALIHKKLESGNGHVESDEEMEIYKLWHLKYK
ncbi:MAG: hypothetical protein Q7U71_01970 [bacterium]|nr:hypothetical protein [bacterium]